LDDVTIICSGLSVVVDDDTISVTSKKPSRGIPRCVDSSHLNVRQKREPSPAEHRHSDMRLGVRALALAVVPVIALTLLGCLGNSHDSVRTQGRIVTSGGPPRSEHAPVSGAEFELVGAAETVSVRADDRGRFTFHAEPGTYRVVMTGHGPMANETFLAPAPFTVKVDENAKPLLLVVSIK
jgi:hypothetical protein